MIEGYVLIGVEPGELSTVVKVLESRGVTDYSMVFGQFDIIVKVSAEDITSLAEDIVFKIRDIPHIIRSETLVGFPDSIAEKIKKLIT
jgi:uncharacterized protein with GYD domain